MGRDDISAVIHLEKGCIHETENDCNTFFTMSNSVRDLGKMAFYYVIFLRGLYIYILFIYSNTKTRYLKPN